MRGGDFPAYTARVLCSKPCSNWPSAVTAINGTSSTLGSGLGLGAGLGLGLGLSGSLRLGSLPGQGWTSIGGRARLMGSGLQLG